MIYNPDNKVVAFLSGIVDVAETLLLTVLCCIPVVTAGASFTAMHKTMMDIILGRSTSTHKTFFASFKENFKLATWVWLFSLVFAAILFVNVNICWGYTGPQQSFAQVLKGMVIIFICAWLVIFTYAFAFVSRFNVTFKQAINNALLISIGKLGWTLLILFLHAFTAVSIWFVNIYAIPVVCLVLYLQNRILIIALMGRDALKEDKDKETYYE